MFNRNNNRINRGMRHFEGFDMNRGQGRGPGQFGDFRQMNGRDRFFKKRKFTICNFRNVKRGTKTWLPNY